VRILTLKRVIPTFGYRLEAAFGGLCGAVFAFVAIG
jgi:hypothetical protein